VKTGVFFKITKKAKIIRMAARDAWIGLGKKLMQVRQFPANLLLFIFPAGNLPAFYYLHSGPFSAEK
jgi:hypothetical protein